MHLNREAIVCLVFKYSIKYLPYTAHCDERGDEYLIVCSLKLYCICVFLIRVRKTLVKEVLQQKTFQKKAIKDLSMFSQRDSGGMSLSATLATRTNLFETIDKFFTISCKFEIDLIK